MLRFHTNGGPAAFSGPMQREMPRALVDIAEDADNRVLILTGTGDTFMDDVDTASLGDLTRPDVWNGILYPRYHDDAAPRRSCPMPIIAAANGPASIHRSGALLADIVIASETVVFSDYSHPTFGTVPGDGVHVIWEEVLGLKPLAVPQPDRRNVHSAGRRRSGAWSPRSYRKTACSAGRSSWASSWRRSRRCSPTSWPSPSGSASAAPVAEGTALGMAVEGLACVAKGL